MSRDYSLVTRLEKVEAGNREDLLTALANISDFDCDFNGENGIDYAWDETLEEGFESNLEYLLNEVKDIEDDEECINAFIDEWIRNDNYYDEYEVNCLTDSNGRVTVISFVTMCSC